MYICVYMFLRTHGFNFTPISLSDFEWEQVGFNGVLIGGALYYDLPVIELSGYKLIRNR